MDDSRLWAFEESLWTGDADNYREKVDAECLMALPAEPFVFGGGQSLEAVIDTPRWDHVRFENQRAARPQEGLIVIAYTAHAERGEERYSAHCTSTLRRIEHEVWRVVQHSQTLPPITGASK